jgi:energy-coupling factor transporter ATP-binding protein EcfA2
MIIERFYAPENEVSDQGLKEINMPRLGKIVALAGKNGSGKSRLLKKLEYYIGQRTNALPNYNHFRESINELQSIIDAQPDSHNVKAWSDQLEICKNGVAFVEKRLIKSIDIDSFKSLQFVPKKLTLKDSRTYSTKDILDYFDQAKTPGITGSENNCLAYMQQLQTRQLNASHQDYAGEHIDKITAHEDYVEFQNIIGRLLGTHLDRDINGNIALFGKPISDAGLSDGQSVILQLCVALHAQRSEFDNTIFILDEPENHLHPSAVIDLLESICKITGNYQIWIATHSVPLLAYIASIDPMSLWYMEDGFVTNAGRHPEIVLASLLGDEERIGQLNDFTGLPAQLAAINYATESLLPPKTIAGSEQDPQVSQIHGLLRNISGGNTLSFLDYGAGKGRLLEGLFAEATAHGGYAKISEAIEYFAFDSFENDKVICKNVISSHYDDNKERYFNTPEEFFSHHENGSIDVTVMCNVLHEISPRDWLCIFSPQSIIGRSLKNDGYLLIVEDQRIPAGEKAHEYGFIVLDTCHLRTLFSVSNEDVVNGRFIAHDSRGDGRLKAHLISKALMQRITAETTKKAIDELQETAKSNIKRVRGLKPTYANGQLNGFWTQQFANASLYLEGA